MQIFTDIKSLLIFTKNFLDAIASREPALLSVDGHSPLKMSITMSHILDGHSPYKMSIIHSGTLVKFL